MQKYLILMCIFFIPTIMSYIPITKDFLIKPYVYFHTFPLILDFIISPFYLTVVSYTFIYKYNIKEFRGIFLIFILSIIPAITVCFSRSYPWFLDIIGSTWYPLDILIVATIVTIPIFMLLVFFIIGYVLVIK